MDKKRGKFLTVMIVLAAMGVPLALYYYVVSPDLLNQSLSQSYETIPNWYPVYLTASLLVSAISLIGLWLWKKWAVILFFVSAAIAFIVQSFILKPIQTTEITYAINIISTGLWVWAVHRKWKYFT